MIQTVAEGVGLNSEDERTLIDSFLDSLARKVNKDDIEQELLRTLRGLHSRGQFRIQFINRKDPQNSDLASAYGYFSAYDNNICLVTDASNFEKKWLGLKTDFSTFRDGYIDNFISTCLHELMHYACTNAFESYVKIWRDTIKEHIWYVFKNICDTSFYDFVDRDVFNTISGTEFMKNPEFKKAFDAYYNSLIINVRFRLKSLTKRYNDVLSTLYSKHNFKYARFFDNILVNAIKLQEGSFSQASVRLYNAIRKAYIDIEPTLIDAPMKALHYQEILDFSEISCVLASYYKYVVKNRNNIIATLRLI